MSWAIGLLVIALIAGALGFGGIAGSASGIAQILFVVFIVLAIVSFIRGRAPEVWSTQIELRFMKFLELWMISV